LFPVVKRHKKNVSKNEREKKDPHPEANPRECE
jgi:hypothetical protein